MSGGELPAAVARLVGDDPEVLPGYGASRVVRGNGVVAKVGSGAAVEAHVLSGAVGTLPLRVPRLLASGPGFVVMEEVADSGSVRRWSEEELQVLLLDLAALHDAFEDAPEERRGPLAIGLGDYFARVSSYGERRGVVLPDRLAHALDDLGPLIELLAQAPTTLVHGDPYPRNVRRPESGHRVWVDWEDALFGPAVLDLAAWLLEGPWSLGRALDRSRALDVYCGARERRVSRVQLERTLDAAVVAVTVTQDLTELSRQPGALPALLAERLAALERLEGLA